MVAGMLAALDATKVWAFARIAKLRRITRTNASVLVFITLFRSYYTLNFLKSQCLCAVEGIPVDNYFASFSQSSSVKSSALLFPKSNLFKTEARPSFFRDFKLPESFFLLCAKPAFTISQNLSSNLFPSSGVARLRDGMDAFPTHPPPQLQFFKNWSWVLKRRIKILPRNIFY